MRALLATSLLGLLLATAPHVVAHGAAFEQSGWASDLQPIDVELDGAPAPVVGRPLDLRVRVPAVEEAPRVTGARVALAPAGGTGAVEWLALEAQGEEHVARVFFDAPGTWRLRVQLEPTGDTFETDLTVWPAGRFFVEAGDETVLRGVLSSQRDETIFLRVHDADGAPAPRTTDAVAHVTHEDADGRLGETSSLPLEPHGSDYVVRGRWDEPGRLHVRVESPPWAMQPEDRPPLTLLVVPPEQMELYAAAPEQAGDKGQALLRGVAALLAAAATVALVRAWRRA